MLLNILVKGTLRYLPSLLLRINFNISTKINPNSIQMHTPQNSIKSNNQQQTHQDLLKNNHQYSLNYIHQNPLKQIHQDPLKQFLQDQEYKQKSISFYNQVLSAVTNPSLINTPIISADASKRATKYLRQIISPGSYSIPTGIPSVKHNIANKITAQTGISTPSTDNIFIFGGVTQCINTVIRCLIANQNDAIMVPSPQYPLFQSTINLMGGHSCPYYLDEQKGWDVSLQELEKSIDECRKQGKKVKGLVIVNPGNPSGKVLSVQRLKEMIGFGVKRKLVIISDEVHRDLVYGREEYNSSLKVLELMSEQDRNDCELISLYSTGNLPLGHCGVRAGYMYCHNIHSQVIEQFVKLWNFHTCNQLGQIVLDITVNPPLNNDVSQQTRLQFIQEKQHLKNYLHNRVTKITSFLSQFKNISISQINAGKYLFPKINFTKKAIQAAESIKPDSFYCQLMKQKTGITSLPGNLFGTKEGDYHFRLNVTNFTQIQLESKLNELKSFNNSFHQKYE